MTLKTMLADDRTPCVCASNITTVISELLTTGNKLFTWFNSNHMKANPEKNHLLLCSKNRKKAYSGGALVESSSPENYLEFKLILTLLLTGTFLLYVIG